MGLKKGLVAFRIVFGTNIGYTLASCVHAYKQPMLVLILHFMIPFTCFFIIIYFA